MANCFFCYKPVDEGKYHQKCCKRFFGVLNVPELKLDKKLLEALAEETVNKRIAITGVQPKLSLNLEKTGNSSRLTLVGLWGKYILKPQNDNIKLMPEVEDLTMHLASLFKISTCEHALIPLSESYVYLAKRFDRKGKTKIHVEDFCQLGGFQTEQKYDSSYERCGKLINTYCSNKGLDVLNYFELLVFCFLSGNSDMHMKNFSILYSGKEILLSPAYDLINSNLVFPQDKDDTALLLDGRKSNINRKHFKNLAQALNISETVFERVIKVFTGKDQQVFELIEASFLTEEMKADYKTIWNERKKRLLQLK